MVSNGRPRFSISRESVWFIAAALAELLVVAIVASLAESSQVEERAVLWIVVVHVCASENDLRTRDRVRLVVLSIAPLASILRAIESDEFRPELPVCGVSFLVFWLDGHVKLP